MVDAKRANLDNEDPVHKTYEYEVSEAKLKHDNMVPKMVEAQTAAAQQQLLPSGSEARDADTLIKDVDTPKAAQQVSLCSGQIRSTLDMNFSAAFICKLGALASEIKIIGIPQHIASGMSCQEG